MNRRNFLKKTAIGTALIGLTGSSRSIASPNVAPGAKPKNLIFMVSDGMCAATMRFADVYSQLKYKKRSEWMSLYENKIASSMLIETSSANSVVTDSAAASSAWGIGERVNNGSIGTTPDGRKPMPMMRRAKEARKSVGLISTKSITDATPAGWSSNVPNRGQEREIAEQYFLHEYDVVLGGGRDLFSDLMDKYKAKGYNVFQTRDDLLKVSASETKILGLFNGREMPWVIDAPLQNKARPSLEEMTTVALKSLSNNKNGFFLMVEAANTDMAAHENDACAMLQEQLEFDRTIALVNNFVKSNPDTLVIVTTDHGCGGLNVNGIGNSYTGAANGVLNCEKATCSMKYWVPKLGEFDSRTAMVEHIKNATGGMEISKDRAKEVIDNVKSRGKVSRDSVLDILSNDLREFYSTGFTSHNHTAELITQGVYGPGQDAFPNFLENYKVTHIICDLFGLKEF